MGNQRERMVDCRRYMVVYRRHTIGFLSWTNENDTGRHVHSSTAH